MTEIIYLEATRVELKRLAARQNHRTGAVGIDEALDVLGFVNLARVALIGIDHHDLVGGPGCDDDDVAVAISAEAGLNADDDRSGGRGN